MPTTATRTFRLALGPANAGLAATCQIQVASDAGTILYDTLSGTPVNAGSVSVVEVVAGTGVYVFSCADFDTSLSGGWTARETTSRGIDAGEFSPLLPTLQPGSLGDNAPAGWLNAEAFAADALAAQPVLLTPGTGTGQILISAGVLAANAYIGGVAVPAGDGNASAASSTTITLPPADGRIYSNPVGAKITATSSAGVTVGTWASVVPSTGVVTLGSGNWSNGTPIEPFTYSLSGATTLAANGVDNIQVEPGINLRQAQSPVLAMAAGVLAGAGTGVVTIQAANSDTTRISAETDNFGNRPTVTLTIPD